MTTSDYNQPQRITVLDIARTFFERNSCTIFLHINNWLEPIGSGTVVEVGGEAYIITAAHVIKEYPKEKIRISNLRLYHEFFKILDWNWRGGDDLEKHDEAWIRVNFPPNSDIRGLVPPDSLSEFNTKIDEYFIVGYPEKLAEQREYGLANRTTIGMYAHLTRLVEKERWPKSCNQNFDLVLEYSKEHIASDGVRFEAPQAHGISGGGFWMVCSPPSPTWSTNQLKLVGIQTAWDKPNEHVFGIQVGQWVKLLINDRPDLKRFFE